jgi:hypothetical protein
MGRGGGITRAKLYSKKRSQTILGHNIENNLILYYVVGLNGQDFRRQNEEKGAIVEQYLGIYFFLSIKRSLKSKMLVFLFFVRLIS